MKIALIIPAYRPTEDMIPMLEQFVKRPEFQPVVVNDGSGEAYEPIFARVPKGCILLRHEVNKGKGVALKTAMAYILENLSECEYAVTADADGQHLFKDIMMVTESAMAHKGTLVLGSRAFDGKVPLRSKLGNGITREVFAIASGVHLQDTQTGLRAFDRSVMENLLHIAGERYEYEINMLLYAAREGIPIREETIRTVYIDDNSASSFNPLRDSFKIYMCIFKFLASSLIAFVVDFVMLLILKAITGSLLGSVIGARIVSATTNFIINKKVVFQSKQNWKLEFVKYCLLALVVLAINYLLLHLLTEVWCWALVPSKLLVEVILFFFNFAVQGKFIYNRKR